VRDALTVTRLIEAIPTFESESAALQNFAWAPDVQKSTPCFVNNFPCVSIAVVIGAARKSLLLPIMQVAFFLALGSPIVALEPDLSGLANGLVERIGSSKVKSVVVTDFLTPLGTESSTGKYLAAKLAELWAQHDQKFKVVERKNSKLL